jgi:DNA-binding NarL/FixJ family response regulator
VATSPRGRVVAVEDEAFTRNLVAGALEAEGWDVRACATIAEAIAAIEDIEPHAVMCDLDLGPGPSGVDLCRHLVEEWPWIGIVVLSAHTSPELAVKSIGKLPEDVVYLVKSAVSSPKMLSEAVEAAISGRFEDSQQVDEGQLIIVSHEQGEVLRLIAQACSNSAIAEQRGTTLRAAEAMVHRVFHALGIDNGPEVNARVQAAMMWNSGRISVR